MKRLFYLIPILICIGLSFVQAQGTWTQIADFPGTGRHQAIGFSIGDKGYVGIGYDSTCNRIGLDPCVHDFWQYDASTGVWTQVADFAGRSRVMCVSFTIGNKAYIGTGNDGVADKDFWVYDPDANSWAQVTSMDGHERYAAVAFAIDGIGYVGTGYNWFDSIYYKDFWAYDPGSDSWTQKADFGGTARYYAVGFTIGSKGYVGTGMDGIIRKDFWEYDPVTNNWTQKANFGGGPRVSAVGFCLGDKGYIGTGKDDNIYKKDFWEYDPATDTWTQKANYGGAARATAAVFTAGNKGYVGTGFGGPHFMKDFWEYTPDDVSCVDPDVPSITASTNPICKRSTTTLSIESGNLNSATDWQWYKTSCGGTSVGSGASIEVSPASNTTYYVRGEGGCVIAGACAQIAVNVKAIPNANITPLGDLNICTTGSVDLKASNGNYSYQWRKDGSPIPGATDQIFHATIIGNYRVRVTGGNGCSRISGVTTVFKTCKLNEVTSDATNSDLRLYPNPTSGQFMIELNLPDNASTTAIVQVMNTLGQVIHDETVQIANGMLQKEIRLSNDAAEGPYLVKVTANDRVYSTQINYQK